VTSVVPGATALSTVDTTASFALARLAAHGAADKKASRIRLLDVGDLLQVTDVFVICSAASTRQLDVIIDRVEEVCRAHGHKPLRREGDLTSGWLVLDYGDVVVHAFTDEQRAVYDLERLWGDAPVEVIDDTPPQQVATSA